jgi:hypothetical protein
MAGWVRRPACRGAFVSHGPCAGIGGQNKQAPPGEEEEKLGRLTAASCNPWLAPLFQLTHAWHLNAEGGAQTVSRHQKWGEGQV